MRQRLLDLGYALSCFALVHVAAFTCAAALDISLDGAAGSAVVILSVFIMGMASAHRHTRRQRIERLRPFNDA